MREVIVVSKNMVIIIYFFFVFRFRGCGVWRCGKCVKGNNFYWERKSWVSKELVFVYFLFCYYLNFYGGSLSCVN